MYVPVSSIYGVILSLLTTIINMCVVITVAGAHKTYHIIIHVACSMSGIDIVSTYTSYNGLF